MAWTGVDGVPCDNCLDSPIVLVGWSMRMVQRGDAMQGLRRGRVELDRPGQRARYCRRCGAALALAPSAMGGVRCSNCGFTPSITERTAAEITLPRASTAQVATRYVAVPMAIESEPVPRRTHAIQSWLQDLASRGLARSRDWVEELGPPTLRTWITAGAAGLAIAFAIAVVMTIG
jgi:DNA-directed RNA polymerase subunit RPC12/RpoP